MALYTNYYDYPVKLNVRLANKEYGRQKVNDVEIDTPEFTTYQFTCLYVVPGATIDTGTAEIYIEDNIMLDYRSPFTDGVPYTNHSADVKIVFYRISSKTYGQPIIKPNGQHNSPTSTTYQFDTVYVPPGKTVYLGDSVIDHVGVIGVDDPTAKFSDVINGIIYPRFS